MPASARRAARVATALALASASAVGLAACSGGDDLAGQQTGDTTDQGYVSGNGAVREYAADERPDPVSFTGRTDAGTTVSDADYLGSVTVVNFWYAACPPCRAEADDLKAISDEFAANDVRFLGVNVRDGAETAQAFERTHGIAYPSVLDADAGGDSVQTAFSAAGVPPKSVPTTVVLGRDGRATATILGQLDASTLRSLIRTALDESTAS